MLPRPIFKRWMHNGDDAQKKEKKPKNEPTRRMKEHYPNTRTPMLIPTDKLYTGRQCGSGPMMWLNMALGLESSCSGL